MSPPNLISLGRLLSVPLTVWVILQGYFAVAFGIFVAAGLSDAVDGFLAKRFGMETELGRYLDPLADKALLVAVFITLGQLGYLPIWLVILVVSRDVLIVGGVLLTYTFFDGMRPRPVLISKINTAAQIVLAAVVLGGIALDVGVAPLTKVLVYSVGATTVVSGALYLVQWGRQISSQEEGA